jgi:hypothetical protein
LFYTLKHTTMATLKTIVKVLIAAGAIAKTVKEILDKE